MWCCLKDVEDKNPSDSGGHSKHTEWPTHPSSIHPHTHMNVYYCSTLIFTFVLYLKKINGLKIKGNIYFFSEWENGFTFAIYIYIYRYIYTSGVARGVLVIVVGNGHGDTNSNLGRD